MGRCKDFVVVVTAEAHVIALGRTSKPQPLSQLHDSVVSSILCSIMASSILQLAHCFPRYLAHLRSQMQ